MPAKEISINLLGQQDLSHSPWGRLITWSITYGRYIMIGTEIVVLLAFVSRFSLDRKLTDLKEEIAQKQLIIETNLQFEQEIRNLQDRLIKIKTIIKDQDKPVGLLTLFQSLLPPDVYLESFEFSQNKLKVGAVAGTTGGFAQFLSSLTASTEIGQIEIGEIKKSTTGGIEFQFTAQTGATKKK
ncbi:MAG: PilN domain-containing protein [Patescibacteria group bacterium]